ncbi:MAG: RQC domain-containing protein, partial [Rhodanobacteraceae bacterium]
EERKRVERAKLDALLGYAETVACRRQRLLAYFGEEMSEPCGNCDNCLDPPVTWDATEAAQKALSCIYRTGQRFGAAYVSAVLRGEDDDRMRGLGHDRLSTFGVGAELDDYQWRGVLRQLLAAGLLATDAEGFGTLRLTDASRPLLRGEANVRLRRQADRVERRAARKATRATRGRQTLDIAPHESALWGGLRDLRARLAKEQGVPAYVIFHDATLLAMLRERPQSLRDIGNISGVGERKLERYGEAFLGVLTAAPATGSRESRA